MKLKQNLLLAAITLIATISSLAAAQAAQPDVQLRYSATLGHYLTAANGMTLYTFAKDQAGVSNCNDGCAAKWPPFTVMSDSVNVAPLNVSGEFSIITRNDGSKQVAYNGLPLYFWVNDKVVGDTTGQGVKDVWFVANLNPTVQVLETANNGNILVGPTGMTLYTFDADEADKSNCNGGCAAKWPPLMFAGNSLQAGKGVMAEFELGTIERADGGMQVTYNGKPLYYWFKDHTAGDVGGNGVKNVWHIVNP